MDWVSSPYLILWDCPTSKTEISMSSLNSKLGTEGEQCTQNKYSKKRKTLKMWRNSVMLTQVTSKVNKFK